MKKPTIMLAVAISMMTATPALADFCDYTPSELIGAKPSAAAQGTPGAVAGAGIGLKYGAGIYTLTHSTSGSLMLGSVLPGASAAGTKGIIAGSAAYAAPVAAVMSAPVIIGALVVAGGIAAYEGGCWLAGE